MSRQLVAQPGARQRPGSLTQRGEELPHRDHTEDVPGQQEVGHGPYQEVEDPGEQEGEGRQQPILSREGSREPAGARPHGAAGPAAQKEGEGSSESEAAVAPVGFSVFSTEGPGRAGRSEQSHVEAAGGAGPGATQTTVTAADAAACSPGQLLLTLPRLRGLVGDEAE